MARMKSKLSPFMRSILIGDPIFCPELIVRSSLSPEWVRSTGAKA
jgi:hypothetical protein